MTITTAVEPGIDAKTLYQKVGFKPHSPGQAEYLNSTARFNVPCCGRRYGKSIAAGHRMTYKSFVPDSFNWIVGPTYKLGEKEFRIVWQDYTTLGLLKYCRKAYSPHQGDMYIKTPWNAVIEVVSADKPDSLLGEGLSHAIMSEAARHNQATWEQFVEPALSDLRGSCDFPSTPKGYNWYHGLWLLGQENLMMNHTPSLALNTSMNSDTALTSNTPRPAHDFTPGLSQYRSWQFPTWENTVRFPGGYEDPEIQRVLSRTSRNWFDQEYGASFTTMTGVIFEEWDEKKYVINTPYEFRPDCSNYQTFDYGFSNPFVCLDIQVMPDDTCIVWREYYQSFKSTHEHGIFLLNRENPAGYHVDGRWGDPRGADQAATLALTIGYVAQDDVKWVLAIEEIKRLLKADKIRVHHSCVNLIRQLSQLHVKEHSRQSKFDLQEMAGDGNIQHKVDDHAIDAFRYFIGPYYVNGAGIRLADIYDQEFMGSESDAFVKMTLDSMVTL